ncbi:hypothetical protein [Flavobacterium sp. C4GT6]|uniref:hypothetical protein n=1 Tax=Flavobacterium sp. C4GT6 TaxID=3103818 RepID=UPI002ED3FD45
MKKNHTIKIVVFVLVFALTIIINVLIDNSKSSSTDAPQVTAFVNEIEESNDLNVFLDNYFPNQPKEVREHYFVIAEKIKQADDVTIVCYTKYNEPDKAKVNAKPELVYILLVDNQPIYVMTDEETGKVTSVIGLRKGDVIIGWV